MKVAIIGAGASGLLLASKICDHHDVTIYEKNSSYGRKLLATGNGKANIGNANIDPLMYNDKNFMENFIKRVNMSDVLNEFSNLGLVTKTDSEGRIYPISESSQTVLDVIVKAITKAEFLFDNPVKKIEYRNSKWIINNDTKRSFDHIVCTTGSIAGIIAKNQSFVYDYLQDYRIPFSNLTPSLCGFKTSLKVSSISGVRFKALCKLFIDNELVHEEAGEVIFKDNGLSGIVIMNMSSIYANSKNKSNAYLSLDFLPDMSEDELANYLKTNNSDLTGLVHPKFKSYLHKNDVSKLKQFIVPITGTYDFLNSQVVHGGVLLNAIDDDLCLKKNKTMHFCGEVLDIDGRCGGYNLFFAFASAILVGRDLNNYEL